MLPTTINFCPPVQSFTHTTTGSWKAWNDWPTYSSSTGGTNIPFKIYPTTDPNVTIIEPESPKEKFRVIEREDS